MKEVACGGTFAVKMISLTSPLTDFSLNVSPATATRALGANSAAVN